LGDSGDSHVEQSGSHRNRKCIILTVVAFVVTAGIAVGIAALIACKKKDNSDSSPTNPGKKNATLKEVPKAIAIDTQTYRKKDSINGDFKFNIDKTNVIHNYCNKGAKNQISNINDASGAMKHGDTRNALKNNRKNDKGSVFDITILGGTGHEIHHHHHSKSGCNDRCINVQASEGVIHMTDDDITVTSQNGTRRSLFH
jgi:hypothetical protein